jgi:hypothetical protein
LQSCKCMIKHEEIATRTFREWCRICGIEVPPGLFKAVLGTTPSAKLRYSRA